MDTKNRQVPLIVGNLQTNNLCNSTLSAQQCEWGNTEDEEKLLQSLQLRKPDVSLCWKEGRGEGWKVEMFGGHFWVVRFWGLSTLASVSVWGRIQVLGLRVSGLGVEV